jgi:hypothetical protein
MADGSEWVEDVRRWYFAGRQSRESMVETSGAAVEEVHALGYEAADPALQAQHWPDAPAMTAAPARALG